MMNMKIYNSTFAKIQLTEYMCVCLVSVLFHWSVGLYSRLSHYLDYCNFLLYFEINPPNVFFFNIALVILDLYTFTYILVLICQFLSKKNPEILIGITFNL